MHSCHSKHSCHAVMPGRCAQLAHTLWHCTRCALTLCTAPLEQLGLNPDAVAAQLPAGMLPADSAGGLPPQLNLLGQAQSGASAVPARAAGSMSPMMQPPVFSQPPMHAVLGSMQVATAAPALGLPGSGMIGIEAPRFAATASQGPARGLPTYMNVLGHNGAMPQSSPRLAFHSA